MSFLARSLLMLRAACSRRVPAPGSASSSFFATRSPASSSTEEEQGQPDPHGRDEPAFAQEKWNESMTQEPEDLYARPNRTECPSPLPGIDAAHAGGQSAASMPGECYPIHDDPAAPHAHPDEEDKRPTQQHPAPRPIEELVRDPDVITSCGDPDAKTVEQCHRVQQDKAQEEEAEKRRKKL